MRNLVGPFPFFGTVSHGTMQERDLIPCFVEVAQAILDGYLQNRQLAEERAMLEEIRERMARPDYFTSEDAGYDLNEVLFDMLDSFAPEGYVFSSHPGNGSDYGFWPVEEQ